LHSGLSFSTVHVVDYVGVAEEVAAFASSAADAEATEAAGACGATDTVFAPPAAAASVADFAATFDASYVKFPAVLLLQPLLLPPPPKLLPLSWQSRTAAPPALTSNSQIPPSYSQPGRRSNL
jgi:hypothetical protein